MVNQRVFFYFLILYTFIFGHHFRIVDARYFKIDAGHDSENFASNSQLNTTDFFEEVNQFTSRDSITFEDELESIRTISPPLTHSSVNLSIPKKIPDSTVPSTIVLVSVAPNSTTPSPITEKPRIIKIANNCPDLEDGDSYTQAAFLERLTAPCRYDKLTKPEVDLGESNNHNEPSKPVEIYVQIDIRHVEASEHLEFKMHMLLQYRYKDPRLDYTKTSPNRTRIVGEDQLRNKIWVPHILFDNERESTIMGHDARDIYMAIESNGEVTYVRRIKATLYCWMDLQKFPFDEQECDIRLLSWTYNSKELLLKWEKKDPVVIANQLHLTEYSLKNHWTKENITRGSSQLRGAFYGNYSSLTFGFHMAREMGFYMLDYFVPSIMLVCISWVSFWLQADASAPRITIGTSTMLSFITLATAQTRTLPKVSYIKASEIWFLGCTIFIFGSMVEFAFVNIIWRRKSNVQIKKVNSKYIFKSTLTPRLHRKEMMKGSGALQKSHSCSSLDNNSSSNSKLPQYNNYLTVHSFSAGMSLPRITTESVDDLIGSDKSLGDSNLTVPNSIGLGTECNVDPSGENGGISGACNHQSHQHHHTWTTMTPQEIAQWIDKRSRLVFPCAFVVFNAFYWGFVYWL